MILQELKRQLPMRKVLIYLLLVVGLSVFWSHFIVSGSGVGLMMTGFYTPKKGVSALRKESVDVASVEGKMTSEHFIEAAKAFQEGKIEGDRFHVTPEIKKYHKYIDILSMQDVRLQNMAGNKYIPPEEFTKEMGEEFYKNEDGFMESFIKKNSVSTNIEKRARSLWSQVEKPYTYYSNDGAWSDGLEHISFLSIPLYLLAGFFSLEVISKDRDSEMEELIETSKNHKKLYWIRVCIAIGVSISIYLLAMGIYIGLLSYFLETKGLLSSIQLTSISILNMRLKDVLRYSLVLGGLGIISFSLFGLYLSSKKIPFLGGIILLVGTVFLNFILAINFRESPLPIVGLSNLLPGSGMMTFYYNGGIPLTSIFGKVFLWLQMNPMVTLGVTLILAKLGSKRRG